MKCYRLNTGSVWKEGQTEKNRSNLKWILISVDMASKLPTIPWILFDNQNNSQAETSHNTLTSMCMMFAQGNSQLQHRSSSVVLPMPTVGFLTIYVISQQILIKTTWSALNNTDYRWFFDCLLMSQWEVVSVLAYSTNITTRSDKINTWKRNITADRGCTRWRFCH